MLCIKLISKSRTNLKTNNHCQKISDDSLIFFLITFDKEGQRFLYFLNITLCGSTFLLSPLKSCNSDIYDTTNTVPLGTLV